ncbi:MAG: Fic family protein [Lactococcus sp.]|uniref:Fic family cell division protein n=1 Tax=Pseudolactococcus piscium MKFS47 TaxID=297352 RepID=A0A0D6DVU3_9LACT|nr:MULTISPECIES: Fic family protein [Lactobacillales]MBQ6483725.1 Fic family protein [Carnobacterium sp.]MCJ1972163.1 Fic family protein [Lactococcus carnosus]MDN5408873.1 Fic family protein [Lactococcus sp.]MDN5411773.1 Fic family protein [Lactococcus sp.]MDN5435963.1 Fic family protein [Lactococcus sp.]
MTNTNLKSSLLAEKSSNMPGGLYHKTQVQMTYNSNRIEGSKLSEEQTRAIFETKTLGISGGEVVNVDDIIETTNHFREFDCMLSQDSLTLDYIKKLHSILKTGTADDMKTWFSVGDWKRIPNEVGDMPTTRPENVQEEMEKLLAWYENSNKNFEAIVEFHYRFEKIHPFQVSNGRVGRLLMFGELLTHDITPFVILDTPHKLFYYRGLKEFENQKGFLIDTCRSAQDIYLEWVSYFYPDIAE